MSAVRIYIPVSAALEMAVSAEKGVPGDYDIPICDPGHWRQVVATVRNGDEIAIVGEVSDLLVVEIPAVVVALHGEKRCIEVIA